MFLLAQANTFNFVDDLLHRMDDADVGMAIVSPVDHYISVNNIQGNDLVINAIKTHSRSFDRTGSSEPGMVKKPSKN